MLLRGEDKYGYWGADPLPKHDLDQDCINAMTDTREKFMSITAQKIEAGGRS
jgi:hypothetical protein